MIGRFAPSPTGRMHLGNVWCALASYLSVKSQGGRWVLRIEDLDPERSRQAYADQLMRDLEWLGLQWDEGPYYQHNRSDYYASLLEQLSDDIFPCYCSRSDLLSASAPHASDGRAVYSGRCRSLTLEQRQLAAMHKQPSLRMRVPDAAISFQDRVYGPRTYSLARDTGDFIVRRSDGVFAYHLAVVADDHAQGVTEIVRGCDLLPATAPQLLLYDRLGFPRPVYAHIPLLVASDGSRLCKRDKALDLGALQASGVSPERLFGSLGAASGLLTQAEDTPLSELLERFDWRKIPTDPIKIPL
ncbi:MAG: tRNA glutamyl-Q(34) synthetase GluQRS [Paludibacteraceae bacterium]|nr:tRNA glutamyl-Q(34) synthetase GluQRS [Paludibacteraceae bacterium]